MKEVAGILMMAGIATPANCYMTTTPPWKAITHVLRQKHYKKEQTELTLTYLRQEKINDQDLPPKYATRFYY